MILKQKHDGDFGKKQGPGFWILLYHFLNLAPNLGFRACLAKVRQRTADQWQLRLCTRGLQTSTVECLARSPERPEEWKHDLYNCFPASVYPIWESSWHDGLSNFINVKRASAKSRPMHAD